MKVLVCGSRSVANPKYHDRETALAQRETVHQILAIGYGRYDLLIHGEAPGADITAGAWAWSKGILVKKFPADWKRYGKAAGPRRNSEMLSENPDVVLAFIDKPLIDSRGTRDMVTKAHDAGITVHVYDVNTGEKIATYAKSKDS